MEAGCALNEASICQLGTCIQKVKGLPANSASPSDTWLLDFKPGTVYIDATGKPVEIPHAFCKVFIEPASLDKWLGEMDITPQMAELWRPRFMALQGLEYELRFSEFVQKTIIDAKKSPHFVRTFSAGKSCKFNDLKETLEKGNISYAAATLVRNMYYSLQLSSTRPSISDPTTTTTKEPSWNNFQFSFLLTQQINPQWSKNFQQWIREFRNKNGFLPMLFMILFQICQACYALYLEKACHNDLHSQNIWITHRPGFKQNVKYVIGSKIYIFPDVDNLVRLFDFDRSYAESLGPNPILQSSLCASHGQCNSIAEPKDFVKILCYVVKSLSTPLQQQIVKSILVDEGKETIAIKIFDLLDRAGCFPSEEIMNDESFKEFPSYDFMLEKIYRLWVHYSRKVIIFEDVHADETFTLNPPHSADEKEGKEEHEEGEVEIELEPSDVHQVAVRKE